MIAIPDSLPSQAFSVPRPSILGVVDRTITDRFYLFLAKPPMMQESRFQIAFRSHRVAVISKFPHPDEEKQLSLLLNLMI
jgi:hypothetical protein